MTMKNHPVLWYILKRVLFYIVTIVGAFTVAFMFFRLVPGDPIAAYVHTMQQQYGHKIPDAESVIERYREMMGLNGTLWDQYVAYLRNILRGRMGPSFLSFPTPAEKYVFEALPWTIGLLGTATLISWIFGFLIGGILGWRRESKVSALLTNISLVLSQIPPYFMALTLLFIFAYGLVWLPRRGAFNAGIPKGWTWPFIKSVLRHSILPAMSLVVISVSGWLISTRSLVISILGEDYLLFAKSKGLRDSHILYKYVLRNAMLPQVTGLAMSLGFILNGAYLVEYVFVYPGMGTLFLSSISMLDYNLVQGIMLMSIVLVLTATLLIDLLLPLVDPRVSYGREA
jgi:peptide/nickel transport system permease protein